MKLLWHHTIAAFFGSLLCVILVNAVVNATPVTVLMKVEAWKQHSEGETITASVVGFKIKDCPIVTGSWVGWVYLNDAWREVPFRFVDDFTPEDSNPPSTDRQEFGFWEWSTPSVGGTLLKMTAQHVCNGKVKASSFGPFQYTRD